jgi:hypothetical protein
MAMTEATKGIIVWLLNRMENLEHELLAHRIVLEAVKSGLPARGVAEVLQAARQSADVHGDLDVKYQSIRERFFRLVDDAGVDQASVFLQQTWNPDQPPN